MAPNGIPRPVRLGNGGIFDTGGPEIASLCGWKAGTFSDAAGFPAASELNRIFVSWLIKTISSF